jgi:hypothetical protein
MSEIDDAKAELKKLSARALKLKMDLHDLSEELPVNWETIPDVAKQCHEAYRLLDEKRRALAALQAG